MARYLADDNPAAIRALVGGSTIRCRTALSLPNLMALPAVRRAEAAGAEALVVTGDAVATVRALIAADATLADLRVADASLEDAIAGLLQAERRIAA